MFDENQYGFIKQRSTVDAVTKFINDVIKSYDDRSLQLLFTATYHGP